MGELILCERPLAANPIYIDEAGINIYSLEELSYYIYNNVYLLNEGFISNDLIAWIGHELSLTELEDTLRKASSMGAPLHTFVGLILQYSGYLTRSEVKQTVETIASFENKSPIECQKMKADRLMNMDRIVDAIYEYENILEDGSLRHISPVFVGDVWHNLGSAYARLFFFDEAAACFGNAYKRNRRDRSLRMILACRRCAGDEDGFKETVDRYFVPDDIAESVREEVSALSRTTEIEEFDRRIDSLTEEMSDEDRIEIERIISGWRERYNRLCRI